MTLLVRGWSVISVFGVTAILAACGDELPEDAASEVNEGEMPPSGSGITLSESEKQDLYKWALCK